MKNLKILLILQTIILTLTLTLSGVAQQNQPDYQLHFKNIEYSPAENLNVFLDHFNPVKEHSFDGKIFRIVQFYTIPDQGTRADLSNAGVELLDYLPDYAYFASISLDVDTRALLHGNIRAIEEITPEINLAPALFNAEYPKHALRDNDHIELMMNYFSGLDVVKILESMDSKGFQVTYHNSNAGYLHVVIPISSIETLATLPFVMYLEPVHPVPQPENYTGRTLHRSNTLVNEFPGGRYYDGTGVNVMLQDDGTIGPHIDYQGRLMAQYLSYNSGDHGDHCAGIIMAAGNLDPKGRGNAPGANLYVYAASEYQGFSVIPSHYFSNQIRVSSTSYSDGCNAGYTSLARTMDQQMRLYPSLMHVFSAGNEGQSNCGYGAGPGWGNITGGHKIGKNVIAVANLDYTDGLSGSSSRGPAHDGRIKPDVAAKGTDVYSTINPNTYGLKSGTSMACPGTAGTVAQLYQAYRELNGGVDPPGGLIKALLMNTADDLGNPGPDFKFGWGRINADRAAGVIEDHRFDTAVIANGEVMTHEFIVPDNTYQLRVMVYWTDFEASVNANRALVNNLDITITDPQLQLWYPWVLNHYPHPDSLNKFAQRGIDDRNNVEQVTIDMPSPGMHTLNINGALIPQGPQKYFVVYEFIPVELSLTYPFGGESMVPGETEVIRWDAPGNEGSFTIDYSSDGGQNWSPIAENISGILRYYSWTIPTAITGNGLVRVSRNGMASQNQAPFSIMQVPGNLNIDWVCENEVHLSWNEVYGATSYTVYKLNEKYMDPVGTTTVTSYIVTGVSASQTTWFSVSATGEGGAKGRRAYTIEKLPGVVNCNSVDAMLVSIPSVDWGMFQTCMNINDLSVTVEIKNFGLETITNPEVSYQLDEGTIISEICYANIEPDSTAFFTFAVPVNVSLVGDYLLKTWITYPPDQNPANDSFETSITVTEGTIITPGTIQNFDAFTSCIPVPTCELFLCPLSEGWNNLVNETQDDIDWRAWSGTTPTYGTGPTFDHTTGTAAGKHLFLEASLTCFYKKASLVTPCIDLTAGGSPQLNLWYHAYGTHIGHMHVDVFDGTEIINNIIQPVFGDKGDAWHELNIDLTPWNGKVIGLRIRGYTGGGERSDLAIDDISVTELTGIASGQRPINSDLQVYPNPSTDKFRILTSTAGQDECKLIITDIFGRVCYERQVKPVSGIVDESVDFSGKAKGIYFIELKYASGSLQSKVVIR